MSVPTGAITDDATAEALTALAWPYRRELERAEEYADAAGKQRP